MKLKPITVGGMLRDHFVAQYPDLTADSLALAMNVPVDLVQGLMDNRVNIDSAIAEKLAEFFGNSCEFWLNLAAWSQMSRA